MKKKLTQVKSPKTYDRQVLWRMSMRNSPRLPKAVNDSGVRMEWVGVGWVAAGKPRGDEPLVSG